MSRKKVIFPILILLFFGLSLSVKAETSQTGSGTITFEGEIPTPPKDPENPVETVDPGTSQTVGNHLRIDFVPNLNFGRNAASSSDISLYPKAQLFHTAQEARANYVQISDLRPEASGWTLQVKQEKQFADVKNSETILNGAQLSFDKSWASSILENSYAPTVAKETIKINPGNAYTLATAEVGKGMGTWMISFGASKESSTQKDNTLIPLTEDGKAVIDSEFKKEIFLNKAIELFVPGKTKKEAVTYQTVLTWTLSELP
jgi:hypothetical protein